MLLFVYPAAVFCGIISLVHLSSVGIICICHYATHGCHKLRGWVACVGCFGLPHQEQAHDKEAFALFEWIHYSAGLELYLFCCQNKLRVDLCWPWFAKCLCPLSVFQDVEKEKELRTHLTHEEIRKKVEQYNADSRDHFKMTLVS